MQGQADGWQNGEHVWIFLSMVDFYVAKAGEFYNYTGHIVPNLI